MSATDNTQRKRWKLGLGFLLLYIAMVLVLASQIHDGDRESKIIDKDVKAEHITAVVGSVAKEPHRARIDRAKLVLGLLHLAIALWICHTFFWPLVRKTLDGEIETIAKELEAAKKVHKEALTAYETFQQRAKNFHRDAERIRRDEHERGHHEAEAILASAERAVATVAAAGEDCCLREAADARDLLKAELAREIENRGRDRLAGLMNDATRGRFLEAGLAELERLG